MAERFELGDMVVWVGPGDFVTVPSLFIPGQQYKIIDTDKGDGFPYYLATDTARPEGRWVRDEDVDPVEPAKPLPAPPKFQTLEEAEAWLEAHADDTQAAQTAQDDPYAPLAPPPGYESYSVRVTRRVPVAWGTDDVEVFKATVNVVARAPEPIRTALLDAYSTYDAQPF